MTCFERRRCCQERRRHGSKLVVVGKERERTKTAAEEGENITKPTGKPDMVDDYPLRLADRWKSIALTRPTDPNPLSRKKLPSYVVDSPDGRRLFPKLNPVDETLPDLFWQVFFSCPCFILNWINIYKRWPIGASTTWEKKQGTRIYFIPLPSIFIHHLPITFLLLI